MADLGMAWLDPVPEFVELWPDTEQSFCVFDAMSTQWQYSAMGHRVGLRYEAMPHVMRWLKVPAQCREQVFKDVQIMEVAVLKIGRNAS